MDNRERLNWGDGICENCRTYEAVWARSRHPRFPHGPLCDGCYVMLSIARQSCPLRHIPTGAELDELVEVGREKLRAAEMARRRTLDLRCYLRGWWVGMLLPEERKGRWSEYFPRAWFPELDVFLRGVGKILGKRDRDIREIDAQNGKHSVYRRQLTTDPLQLRNDLEDPDFMHRAVTGIPPEVRP